MKNLIFAILFSIAAIAQAEPYELTNFQDYLDSRIEWNGRRLQMDDLKGNPSSDTLSYQFVWWIETSKCTQPTNHIRYSYLWVKPYIATSKSWIKQGPNQEASLRYINACFDIAEIYARKATRDISTMYNVSDEEILDFYNIAIRERIAELRTITDNGRNESAMERQEQMIADELAEPKFDPSTIDANELNNEKMFDMAIGLYSFISHSSYLSSCPIGFTVSMAGGVKRHVWGLDISMAFGGEFQKDIHTSKGWILEGDDLSAGHIALTYGYSLGNKPGYQLAPFVGTGVSFFEGPHIGNDDSGHREYLEKAGFFLEGGIIVDIPVKRNVNLGVTEGGYYANKSAFYRSIRLKPSVGLNYVADGPGWFPSLNLALLFDWRGYGF